MFFVQWGLYLPFVKALIFQKKQLEPRNIWNWRFAFAFCQGIDGSKKTGTQKHMTLKYIWILIDIFHIFKLYIYIYHNWWLNTWKQNIYVYHMSHPMSLHPTFFWPLKTTMARVLFFSRLLYRKKKRFLANLACCCWSLLARNIQKHRDCCIAVDLTVQKGFWQTCHTP